MHERYCICSHHYVYKLSITYIIAYNSCIRAMHETANKKKHCLPTLNYSTSTSNLSDDGFDKYVEEENEVCEVSRDCVCLLDVELSGFI